MLMTSRIKRTFAFGRCVASTVAVMVFGVLVLATAAQASEEWLTDYDEALAESAKTGKPVMTLFTGSDWCPHCRTLEERVFATPEFEAWSEEHVVLLMIDLPESGISPAVRSERSRICLKYGVRTFPSVLVLDSFGEKITEEKGYRGTPASAWIQRLAAKVPAPAEVADLEEPMLQVLLKRLMKLEENRPVLLVVSGSPIMATIRSATLVNDPEFGELAEESFAAATIPASTEDGQPTDASLEQLLGGTLEPDAAEVIVTEDGETPVFMASGSQSPKRIVSGLRRFVARQASRNTSANRR